VDGRAVFIYPAARQPEARPSPVIVMLHGMCDTPENECSRFHGAASAAGFLLCPRANGACGNGGAMWRGSLESKQALLAAGLNELAAEFPGSVDVEHDATLVGFSQGAYLAVSLLPRERSPFSSLVLIGAAVEVSAERLERAGIRRVVLAAGDFDGARPAMERAAQRLVREGADARFMSLGPVGHAFAPDMEGWMERALAWARASR
jgi:predicted esterase